MFKDRDKFFLQIWLVCASPCLKIAVLGHQDKALGWQKCKKQNFKIKFINFFFSSPVFMALKFVSFGFVFLYLKSYITFLNLNFLPFFGIVTILDA
jgi:hypothetical protein